MSKYTDAQERDAALYDFHDREDADHEKSCGGCGIPLAEHAASAMACRRYQDLLQLVIDWHTGEVQAKVKKQPPDLTAGEFNRREC